MTAQRGHFVKDTTYRSIIRHELGHVVSNMYKLNPMEIAQLVLPGLSNTDIIKYVKENLSLYAADYSDGREFISECFSAYYSGVDNDFAKKTWLSSHRQACGFSPLIYNRFNSFLTYYCDFNAIPINRSV